MARRCTGHATMFSATWLELGAVGRARRRSQRLGLGLGAFGCARRRSQRLGLELRYLGRVDGGGRLGRRRAEHMGRIVGASERAWRCSRQLGLELCAFGRARRSSQRLGLELGLYLDSGVLGRVVGGGRLGRRRKDDGGENDGGVGVQDPGGGRLGPRTALAETCGPGALGGWTRRETRRGTGRTGSCSWAASIAMDHLGAALLGAFLGRAADLAAAGLAFFPSDEEETEERIAAIVSDARESRLWTLLGADGAADLAAAGLAFFPSDEEEAEERIAAMASDAREFRLWTLGSGSGGNFAKPAGAAAPPPPPPGAG